MLLVLTTLVHNVDGGAREQQELTLLKLANAWLQGAALSLRVAPSP